MWKNEGNIKMKVWIVEVLPFHSLHLQKGLHEGSAAVPHYQYIQTGKNIENGRKQPSERLDFNIWVYTAAYFLAYLVLWKSVIQCGELPAAWTHRYRSVPSSVSPVRCQEGERHTVS